MDDILALVAQVTNHPLFRDAFWAVVLTLATFFAAKLAARAVAHVLRNDSNPLPTSSIIINIVRAIIWIIGASIILDSCFNVNTSSLITALGVGGIAVSLGFQDTLSNLIGGLQVTFMGIVKPGDNIEVGSEAGVVQDVSWRHTTIRDSLGQTVIVPNSIISTTALVHLLPANRVAVPFAIPRHYLDELERGGDTSANALPGDAGDAAPSSLCADATGGARPEDAGQSPIDGVTPGNRSSSPTSPIDALSQTICAHAREAAATVSPVVDGPRVFFSEITELGVKGKVILQVEDAAKTAGAADAVVRAIARDLS